MQYIHTVKPNAPMIDKQLTQQVSYQVADVFVVPVHD